MSIDQNERTVTFSEKLVSSFEILSDEITSEVRAASAQLADALVESFGAELADLAGQVRVLDDIVSIVQVTQTSADVNEAQLLRKILQALKGKGLL